MKQNMHEMFTAADTLRHTLSSFSGRGDPERVSAHTNALASLILPSWHWDTEKRRVSFLGHTVRTAQHEGPRVIVIWQACELRYFLK